MPAKLGGSSCGEFNDEVFTTLEKFVVWWERQVDKQSGKACMAQSLLGSSGKCVGFSGG